jgi:hypothetical protein
LNLSSQKRDHYSFLPGDEGNDIDDDDVAFVILNGSDDDADVVDNGVDIAGDGGAVTLAGAVPPDGNPDGKSLLTDAGA